MNPETSADSLQDALLEHCKRPRVVAELAEEWGVELELLTIHVELMIKKGLLARVGSNRVVSPSEETGVGFLSSSGQGRYNVVPDDPNLPLMKVKPEFLGDAIIGDHVLFHVVRRSKGKKFGSLSVSARIMGVLKPRPTEVVGVIEENKTSRISLRLQGRNKPRFCMVMNGPEDLRPGQLVKVALPRAHGYRGLEGEFIEIVADIDSADQDTTSVCALMDLPLTFPEEVLEAAKLLPKDPRPEDFESRLDLRHLTTITIDPADAKDHDDAVSVERLEGDLIRVGVHIADVSHYVTPDSIFDVEAAERGTSTYLPGHTVPMLPEELSAGLCSLKEGHDRLAKSCFYVIAKDGSILRREVYKSIICVKRFFNYQEVFASFQDESITFGEDLDETLVIAREGAQRLRKRRMDKGSIVLSIDRPKLRIGSEGEVIEVKPDSQNEANYLVEEFMLAANRAVARFMLEREMPYLCRVHPAPKPSAQDEFNEFCRVLNVGSPSFEEPRVVQLFLDGLDGLEGKTAIHLAVLKSMMRATYEDKPGLHYALGFYEYTHFTSPIRRICDLTVHQILDRYFEAGGELKKSLHQLSSPWMDGSESDVARKELHGSKIRDASTWRVTLKSIAHTANETERRSSKAEIRANQLKLLRMMQDRIGESFEGTVVHITTSGVIFQLDEIMVEGTLFFRDICDAWVDSKKFWIEYPSRKGKETLKVGDRRKLVIKEIDLTSQSMRLVLPNAAGGFAPQNQFVDYRKKSGAKKGGHRGQPKSGKRKSGQGSGHRKKGQGKSKSRKGRRK